MKHERLRRGLLLAGVMLATLGAPTWAQERAKPKPPERVPLDVPLGKALDGTVVRLSDFDGKPVVVMFWASWCPHCRNELPGLERLQMAATRERARVVAINVEERDVFRQLNRQLSGKMQMLHTYDPDGASAKAFGKADGVPYTVVVRGDGRITKTMSGWCEKGCLEQIVEHVNDAMTAAKAASAPDS